MAQGRRRAVLHARRGDARRAGGRLHGAARASHRRHRPLPDSGARPRRRHRGGLGDRRDPQARRQAARYPGRPRPIPAWTSTCAAPVRSTPRRTTALAGVAEKHKLARLTRHGELVAQARAAAVENRARPGAAAAGRISAGDRRGRSDAGAAGARPCRRCQTRRRSVLRHRHICLAAGRTRARDRRRQRGERDQGARARGGQYQRPEAGGGGKRAICSAARSWPPSSKASTPWCSIRRARAPRRRRANWSKAPCRSWSRCRATRRRFARDARILVDGGYKLARVTPVDQFRYSSHVEMVGKFER